MADQYLGTPVTAFLVLTILTAVTVSGTTQELSTTTGDTVNLPCLFGEGTLSSIFWSYNDGTEPHKILSFANRGLTIDPEYASQASLQDDHSTLILKGITVADEGTYRCDVDRQGQTVVSNINTKLNVFSLRPGTLPVITPCIGVDETSSGSIHANQSFTVTCTLPNVYPFKDTELIWYQDGQRFPSIPEVTQNDNGTANISRQIKIHETGNFTCNATYRSANGKENTAISVVAWIIPAADIPNTRGKNMTVGEIALMTICIGLLAVCIYLAIKFFRSRSKARGNSVITRPSDDRYIDSKTMEVLAENIPDELLNQFGQQLGYNANDMEGRNAGQMLQDWQQNQFERTRRLALGKALRNAGLVKLAVDILQEQVPAEPLNPLNDQ